jgi:hypothetical protein
MNLTGRGEGARSLGKRKYYSPAAAPSGWDWPRPNIWNRTDFLEIHRCSRIAGIYRRRGYRTATEGMNIHSDTRTLRGHLRWRDPVM